MEEIPSKASKLLNYLITDTEVLLTLSMLAQNSRLSFPLSFIHFVKNVIIVQKNPKARISQQQDIQQMNHY